MMQWYAFAALAVGAMGLVHVPPSSAGRMTSGSQRCTPSIARWGKRTSLMIAARGHRAGRAVLRYLLPVAARHVHELRRAAADAAGAGDHAGRASTARRFARAVRGRWTIVVASRRHLRRRVRAKLYATRQARTMQGRERERIERLWLVADDVRPDSERARRASGRRRRAHAAAPTVATLPSGADAIYLDRPARQPGAGVAAATRHQGAGTRPDPPAASVADRLTRHRRKIDPVRRSHVPRS